MARTGPDSDLVDRLRAGDEQAFVETVERYHTRLVRLATAFVPNVEVAEEVAQETWLALLTGIERFEGRSSLRSWLFQVCVNRARSAGAREHRSVPVELTDAVVEPGRFTRSGSWLPASDPGPDPAQAAADARLVARVRRVIDTLPLMQRLVVTMRDVDGLSATQVCDALAISEANQRVLLHRGRRSVRGAARAMN